MFPTVYIIVPHGISPTVYTVDILWGHILWGTSIYTVGQCTLYRGEHDINRGTLPWGTYPIYRGEHCNVPHGISFCLPRYIPHSIYH